MCGQNAGLVKIREMYKDSIHEDPHTFLTAVVTGVTVCVFVTKVTFVARLLILPLIFLLSW